MAGSENKVIMAVDVGEKRVGVALAGTIARLPSPLTILKREGSEEAVAQLVKEHGVALVVVGLPRNMRGVATKQTAVSKQYAASLKSVLEVPVELFDETLSSVRADAVMGERRGEPNDAYAAAVILEDYLNGAGRQ